MLLESQDKKVVLITSGQPSANPRLVKEANALAEAGYNVTVIYAPISPWADKFDQELFKKYSHITFIKIGYHSYEQKWGYSWARGRRKFLSFLHQYIGDIYNLVDYTFALFAQELLKEAKKHKADLYIAHNLAALPVAVKAAQFNNAKVGFDAEDFHRGEVDEGSYSYFISKAIEDKYIPGLSYLTAASPPIYSKYTAIYTCKNSCVINNVFSKEHIASSPTFRSMKTPLKLFWFSQTIGVGRGLEDVIEAVCNHLSDEPVVVTLVGNCSKMMRNYLASIVPGDSFNKKVQIKEPVASDELFNIAIQHHIGLALEPGRDLNNDIALSNKIFTYLLAGNALILSDTQAQKEFYKNYPHVGSLYSKGNSKSIANIISAYLKDSDLLSKHQTNALHVANVDLNWDVEKKIFLSLIESVLRS